MKLLYWIGFRNSDRAKFRKEWLCEKRYRNNSGAIKANVAQNYADMLVRFGSIIETCNKINGYWESDGWTEIYEDMADKSDRMNEIVDDMTNYYKDIVNITESYDAVEAINVDIGESLSGDVIN